MVLMARVASAHLVVDMRLSIYAPAFVASGQRISYQIGADNLANDQAFGVIVTDTLPPSVAFVKVSGVGWNCSESKLKVTCSAEALDPGRRLITIEVTAPAALGAITNTASIETLGSTDPNPANDQATAKTTIYDAAACGPAIQALGPSGTVSSPVRLSWTAVPNAQRYDVSVSVEGERQALVGTTTQTSIVLPIEAGNVSWRVEAIRDTCPNVVTGGELVVSGAPERLVTNVLAAGFSDPTGLALDSSGNLFVADSGNFTIHQVSPTGAVTLLAGTMHVAGSSDGRPGTFNAPTGIAISPLDDFLFIADSGNHEVRLRYPGDASLGYVITIGGLAGHAGIADGNYEVTRFSSPAAIAADPRGRLYVADTANNRIRAMTSVPGYVGYYSTTTFASCSAPRGVAVDGENIVYIADTGSHRVRQYWGDMITTFEGFNEPTAMAVDGKDNVYVCDTGDGTIRKLAPSGRVTTVLSGLNRPEGIAIDANGTIYISDTGNHRVLVAHVATPGIVHRRAARP